ncbi:hypothetical protein PIB30_026357 [Stylosanthes scabra]|uniref:Uncharacterized protein n=1 Tax=Stylosanthes scabra TaxID=79078 RepID=A0ABU6Z811_9FABA|nr:hypothetical protein [Stylosanthes scabra]
MGIQNHSPVYHRRIPLQADLWAGGIDPRGDKNPRKSSDKRRGPERTNGNSLQQESRSKIFQRRRTHPHQDDIGLPTPGEGKLAANWKGPYKVKHKLGKGYHKIATMDGNELLRTWHSHKLRAFYY